MKFENTDVWGFEHALRGMRNPMNSWAKSDSEYKYWCNALGPKEEPHYCNNCGYDYCSPDAYTESEYVIGENDMRLATTLIAGGSEHRKFLRQIFVSVDITAPLYWWKEFDTYKVGTVANSTSTMHKLTSQPITLDCFESDDYSENLMYYDGHTEWYADNRYVGEAIEELLIFLEHIRQIYLETKDKRYWKELVRWLPESWLQTRTVTMNYENLRTMYHQRKNHKLNEWSGCDNPKLQNFIAWIETLPYAKEFIMA